MTKTQIKRPRTTYRDPYIWPYASTSIWNTPIGTGATYVDANLPAVPRGDPDAYYYADEAILVQTPTSPVRDVRHSDGGWGGDRCVLTGTTYYTAPVPDSFIIGSSGTNHSAAVLDTDGVTLRQFQPFARCSSGSNMSAYVAWDTGAINGDGRLGAHGGSGMSSTGGCLRSGELSQDKEYGPRHALSLGCDMHVLAPNSAPFFTWPAQTADGYASTEYGTISPGPGVVKMGALLAIPQTVNLNTLGLETHPMRLLAWTFQNYGGYVVDDTWGGGFLTGTYWGPDYRFIDEFDAEYPYDFNTRNSHNTAWSRDWERIFPQLHVVSNNSSTDIGGPGNRLQPTAPALP